MRKIAYLVVAIAIQYSTFNVPNSYAQAPINTPDNIGAGNSLDFDGINDYVRVSHDNSLNVLGSFTISAWVYIHSYKSYSYPILYKGNEASSNEWYELRISTTGKARLRLRTPTENAVVSVNSVPLNEWSYITGHYDGTTMKVYINGEEENSHTVSGSYNSNSSHDLLMMVSINSATTGLRHYVDGLLDEVRIWDHALTQSEIKDNMCKSLQGNETGLVGYWNMNEGTGNTITDLTTNGNDGTLQ